MPDIFVHFLPLPKAQQDAIAQGIYDIFAEELGSKPGHVHTRFPKLGDYYIGGKEFIVDDLAKDFANATDPEMTPNFRINVELFPGRSEEKKQEITNKLGALVERVTGIPAAKVEMHTSDLHNQNLFIAGGADWIPNPA